MKNAARQNTNSGQREPHAVGAREGQKAPQVGKAICNMALTPHIGRVATQNKGQSGIMQNRVTEVSLRMMPLRPLSM